jgi:glutaredoxin
LQPEHLAEFSARLPRSRALPQLFIAGEHIGSWEDLLEWTATAASQL